MSLKANFLTTHRKCFEHKTAMLQKHVTFNEDHFLASFFTSSRFQDNRGQSSVYIYIKITLFPSSIQKTYGVKRKSRKDKTKENQRKGCKT